jgi:hypothetical protein
MRFNNMRFSWRSTIAMIVFNTTLFGNNTKLTGSSSKVHFIVLKAFDFNSLPPKPPLIKEVIWKPPLVSWTKCNYDGAALGIPNMAACGGIFRNHNAVNLGCFAVNNRIKCALSAELIGELYAIGIASFKGWNDL